MDQAAAARCDRDPSSRHYTVAVIDMRMISARLILRHLIDEAFGGQQSGTVGGGRRKRTQLRGDLLGFEESLSDVPGERASGDAHDGRRDGAVHVIIKAAEAADRARPRASRYADGTDWVESSMSTDVCGLICADVGLGTCRVTKAFSPAGSEPPPSA